MKCVYSVERDELLLDGELIHQIIRALAEADIDPCWKVANQINDEIMDKKLEADPSYIERVPGFVRKRLEERGASKAA